MTRHRRPCRAGVILLGLALTTGGSSAAEAPADTAATDPPPGAHSPAETAAPASQAAPENYAIVNGQPITMQEYVAQLNTALRQRYYHGKVPDGQMEVVQREVGDSLIERILLLEEIKRRDIQPDRSSIDRAIAEYDALYGASEAWKQQRAERLPGLTAYLERRNLLEQLERQVRQVPTPTPQDLRSYYDQHPDRFTEPEKLRLSAILLKVDPAATKEIRAKAREDAQAIFGRLKAGADFAAEARQYSNDDSASRGGDLGYVHRGMLPEALHAKIDTLAIGELTEPLAVLEGMAIFRLDDRVAPRLREFADMERQAQDLLLRDRAEEAWKAFVRRLRESASIVILAAPSGVGTQG